MTRSFEEALNLPHLEDILKDQDADLSDEPVDPEFEKALETASETLPLMNGADHAEAMDEVYEATLKHAKDIIDLGFNIDHARAARMFEVGATMFKVAVDAKNSKRDMQLKAMKLALEQQEIARRRREDSDEPQMLEAKAIVVEDRNELIRRLREQAKKEKGE